MKKNVPQKVFLFLLILGSLLLTKPLLCAASNELIDVDSSGLPMANGFLPAISSDGRFVAFASQPDNYNHFIYVRDRLSGTTEPVSIDTAGQQISGSWPSISGDGRYVAFEDSWGWTIYLRDRQTEATEVVSLANDGNIANGYCGYPSVSADGRYVAFISNAWNLPGFDGYYNVYVRDRVAQTTKLISSGTYRHNAEGPVMSGDGRYVLYIQVEDYSNRFGLYRYDMQTNTRTKVECLQTVGDWNDTHALSYNGRYIAFSSQCVSSMPSSIPQVYVKDMQTGNLELVSVDNNGNPHNYYSSYVSMSYDGRFVSFFTQAQLDPADTNNNYDVYVRDRENKRTAQITKSYDGQQPDNASFGGFVLSGDGKLVAFTSNATNLVSGYTGLGFENVYVTSNVLNTDVLSAECTDVTTQTDPGICTASGVSIDNGSTDPGGDTFTLSQSPANPYPEGTTDVTLTITGQSSTCTGRVTVKDLEKPTITCLNPKVECTSPTGAAVVTLMDGASDNCAIQSTGCTPASGSAFPLGVDTFTCTAMDTSGNTTNCTSKVTVVDTTGPAINSVQANPGTLWPPSHTLVPISITATATDTCDTSPECKIVSVTSNGPVRGPASGKTQPDWIISDPGPKASPAILGVQLRAERAGSGTDRVYTITVSCTDASGNTTLGQTTVSVPHDQGR